MDSRWLVRKLDIPVNNRQLSNLASMAMSKDPSSPDLLYTLGWNDSVASTVRVFNVTSGVELPGVEYRADAASFNWTGRTMSPYRIRTFSDSILLYDLHHRGFCQINLTNSLWIQAWQSTDAFFFDVDLDGARDRIVAIGELNSRPVNGPYFLAWYPTSSNISILSVPLFGVNGYSDTVAVSLLTGNVFVSSQVDQSVREYSSSELILLREISMGSRMTNIYTEVLVDSHDWLIVSIASGIWYCSEGIAPALLPTGDVQTIKTRGALALALDSELIFLAPSITSNYSSLLLGVSLVVEESTDHLSAGVIAAITIGVVTFLLVVAVVTAYTVRGRSARASRPTINELITYIT